MQKITTFLWFDNNAEEAVTLYTSIFKNSKIISMTRYGKGMPGPEGTVMSAIFELEGQRFHALNGGPHYKFTPAISLFVDCVDQAEIDDLWSKLTANGGQESRCGWLVDKFGLSWQIVPRDLFKMLSSGDAKKSQNVMMALMPMAKLDIKTLQEAFDKE